MYFVYVISAMQKELCHMINSSCTWLFFLHDSFAAVVLWYHAQCTACISFSLVSFIFQGVLCSLMAVWVGPYDPYAAYQFSYYMYNRGGSL